MLKPEDLQDASEYILTGSIKESRLDHLGIDLDSSDDSEVVCKRSIKSSSNSRELFHKKQNEKYNKKRSAL